MKRTVPIMNGYKTIWDNVGKTRNKGVEFTLNTVNIRNKNFEWSTGIIFSLNRDKIVDLRGDKKMISPISGSSANLCEFTTTMTLTVSGRKVTNSPILQQTVPKRNPKGAKPGSAKVKDADGNGYIDSNDKVIIGSKNPSFLMSMSNTLTYKISICHFTERNIQGYT